MERVKLDFPSLIILDGGQGQGKTTLMTHIINHYNKRRGLPRADLSKQHHPQIALGGKEFTKNFNVCKSEGLPVIGYDEAGDFSRRGSISRFNSMINRRFETFRSSNIIVILCLPNFNVLDMHLYDLQIPRILLHLRDRELTKNFGNYDGYSLYGMNWIRYWFDKLNKAIRYKCYDKVTPNFRGHFLDLAPEERKQLKALSDMGKDRESQKAEIKAEGLLSYIDLASKLGWSVSYTRQVIRKIRFKKTRTIGGVSYFHEDLVNRLLDHKEGVDKPLD